MITARINNMGLRETREAGLTFIYDENLRVFPPLQSGLTFFDVADERVNVRRVQYHSTPGVDGHSYICRLR
jgi:hypothetical protein